MRRLGRHTQGVLRAALACGMGVQILLGLAWLMQNMGGLQNFQESRLLLAGESTGNGFYSGILYRGLALLLSSRLWILYVVQLSAAFAAAWVLWACFFPNGNKRLRLLCTLALVTFPQAMQCHLAVLPWSLGTSLLVGETVEKKRKSLYFRLLFRKISKETLEFFFFSSFFWQVLSSFLRLPSSS